MTRLTRIMPLLLLTCALRCVGGDSAPRSEHRASHDSLDVLTAAAKEFLAAAQRGDAARMRELAFDNDTVFSGEEVARDHADLVQAALSEMVVKAGSLAHGDTAGVVYTVRRGNRRQQLSFTFRRAGGAWLVYRVVLPEEI